MKVTTRQYEALSFIGWFVRNQSKAPTLREIGAHMGIGSTNGVKCHLRALKVRGLVDFGYEAKARDVIVTPLGWQRLGYTHCEHCGSIVDPRKVA